MLLDKADECAGWRKGPPNSSFPEAPGRETSASPDGGAKHIKEMTVQEKSNVLKSENTYKKRKQQRKAQAPGDGRRMSSASLDDHAAPDSHDPSKESFRRFSMPACTENYDSEVQSGKETEMQSGKETAKRSLEHTYIVPDSAVILGLSFETLPPTCPVVSTVHPNTWAQGSGIVPGDQLLSINGRKVEEISRHEFFELMPLRPLELSLERMVDEEVDAAGLDLAEEEYFPEEFSPRKSSLSDSSTRAADSGQEPETFDISAEDWGN